MTPLTYNGLIDSVLRLMDENGGHAQFMSGNATEEMRDIIGQVSEDAIRKIHLQAPVAMLDAVWYSEATASLIERNGRYICQVVPPGDFFRLVRCGMGSWVHSVSHLWWEDSAEYAKQKNKYLMGTYENPIAFLVHRNEMQLVEMYSSESLQDHLSEFLYVKRPEWGGDRRIMVSDRLRDASLMQVAADALAVLGENERARLMQQMAERAMTTYSGSERDKADNGNRIER